MPTLRVSASSSVVVLRDPFRSLDEITRSTLPFCITTSRTRIGTSCFRATLSWREPGDGKKTLRFTRGGTKLCTRTLNA